MTKITMFSTPTCGVCPEQKEILRELGDDRDDVDVEFVDATEDMDRANKFGVRSVPTTIIHQGDTGDTGVDESYVGLTEREELVNTLDA